MSRKFAERAACAFMIVGVNVSRWEGIAKLKRGAAEAAERAGANPSVFRGYVNLLGQHHADLKAVASKYRRIYNFLEERTVPYDRGEYLCPVALVPKLLNDLNRLVAKADDERDRFLLDYERLVKLAQSDDMGSWRDEVSGSYPTVDEIRDRFGVVIKTPKALPVSDMSRINLPADLAAQIADEQAAMIDDKLAQAKDAALDAVETSLGKVVKQLSGGKRFHQSLIDNLRRDAEMLREMTKGYDCDPRLIALADKIDAEVLNVDTVDKWRWEGDKSVRSTAGDKAHDAAEQVSKSLKTLRSAPPADKPKAGKVRAGGIMGRKLAKSKS